MLSFNVKLASGASKHISFESRTNGTSAYQTSNEAVQKALEEHPYFHKWYVLKGGAPAQESKKTEKKVKLAVVEGVTNPMDAKQYLVDKYEVSRTQIRNTKDIQRIAAQFGITFNLG